MEFSLRLATAETKIVNLMSGEWNAKGWVSRTEPLLARISNAFRIAAVEGISAGVRTDAGMIGEFDDVEHVEAIGALDVYHGQWRDLDPRMEVVWRGLARVAVPQVMRREATIVVVSDDFSRRGLPYEMRLVEASPFQRES